MSNVLIKSLPVVASMLSERTGVEVIVQGSQACTDGNKIIIPELPDTEDAWILARGYIDHESAHLKETDMSVFKSAPNAFVKVMTNIIEDIRIEDIQGRRYPGCAVNLRRLTNHLAKEHKYDVKNSQTDAVYQAWVSSSARRDYLLHEGAAETAEKTEKYLRKAIGDDLMDETRRLLGKIPSLKSTRQAGDLALELSKLLQKHQKEKEQQQQGGEQGKPSNGPSGNQQGNNQESGESDSSEGGGAPGNGGASKNIEKILNTKKNHVDNGQLAASMMDGQATQDIGQSQGHYPGEQIANFKNSRMDLADIRRKTVGLKSKMNRLVAATRLKRSYSKQIGNVINQRSIHKLALSDPRVFHAKEEKVDVDTAFALLLDRSGSMAGIEIDIARQALLAIADALSSVPKVALTTAAFPSDNGTKVLTLTPFGKTVAQTADNYGISASGGTPLFNALSWARVKLMQRTEKRKIILVITDGEPACVQDCIKLIEKLEKEGHEVLGLGIKHNVEHLFKHHTTIHSLNQLTKALFDMFTKVLTHSKNNY